MAQNAHSTAKGGVIALTLQLVVEGGPHGIRANVISPGLVETPNTAPCSTRPDRLLDPPPPAIQRRGWLPSRFADSHRARAYVASLT